jgi:calcium channel MID1
MLPPNSTPMRSRRLAYIIATYLLFTTWTCANAAEVSAAAPIAAISPTTPPAVQDVLVQLRRDDGDRDRDAGYAPNFDYFDRGVLGRQEPQPPQATELKNNEKKEVEIGPSATMHFMLKGQSGGHVWISANTCRQPVANGNETLKHSRQLVMFVSTSSQNKKPGPDSTDNLVTPQTGILFDEGFARLAVNTTSDVYIGIAAPNPEKDWTGSWSFEIAASADGPYHSYDASNPFLYMIDTDSESALFITYNLNEPNTTAARNWSESNPFSMYAFEAGERSDITGMEHSLCALKSLYGNSSLNTVTTITTKYGANVQKGQFHIQGLKNGTKYNGFLTVEGGKDTLRLQDGGTVRNGGMVFSQFEWITKAGGCTCPRILVLC